MSAVTNADVLTALADLHEAHLGLIEDLKRLEKLMDQRERNAFDLGVDAGAAGLVNPSEAMSAEIPPS